MLINEGKETAYQNYTTQPDYVGYLKGDISEALNNLYSLQNSISLTSLTMSSQQNNLINNKVVSLYFMDTDLAVKVLNFSLSEAVLQIASAIFTV